MKILAVAVVILCLASVAVARRPDTARLSPPDLVPHEHYFEQPDRDPTGPKTGREWNIYEIMFGPEEDGPGGKYTAATFRTGLVIRPRPLVLESRRVAVRSARLSEPVSKRMKR